MSEVRKLSAVLALATVLCTDAAAQNARHSASNIEPDIGPHVMEIESPDSSTLRSFLVPGYEGRVHLGQGIPAPNETPMQMLGSNERAARMRGNYVRTSGLELYLNLLRLGENRDVITLENLNDLYASARPPIRTDPWMRDWAPILEYAARGGLADGPYREVFCVEEVPCPLDRFNGSRPYDIAGQTPVWGAAHNEFRFRAAYASFLENYAQSLIDWGASLNRDAVCTGAMQIGNYDFNKGAYVTRMSCQSVTRLPEGGLTDVSTDDYDIEFSVRSEGELASMVLTWKLDRTEAEALRNELQSRQSRQLFILLTGEIGFETVDREAANHPKLLARNHHFILSGPEVRVFYDAALTEPTTTFSLR
ncbi:MAG: hypothetical protein QNI99_11260 [Woeseiaceae bacterium]|nr:hypothetical protein [Woeseiaceae bacterium]